MCLDYTGAFRNDASTVVRDRVAIVVFLEQERKMLTTGFYSMSACV